MIVTQEMLKQIYDKIEQENGDFIEDMITEVVKFKGEISNVDLSKKILKMTVKRIFGSEIKNE